MRKTLRYLGFVLLAMVGALALSSGLAFFSLSYAREFGHVFGTKHERITESRKQISTSPSP